MSAAFLCLRLGPGEVNMRQAPGGLFLPYSGRLSVHDVMCICVGRVASVFAHEPAQTVSDAWCRWLEVDAHLRVLAIEKYNTRM